MSARPPARATPAPTQPEDPPDFLALVCHELRTPLQAILGCGELLQRDATDETSRARLATIGQQGALLLRLVNDLLDLRAMEAGAFSIRPQPVNLPALVMQTVESCRPAAAAKGLALRCTVAAAAPGWVLADGDRLGQVLLNLVANAIKFTVQGRIDVVLNAAEEIGGAEIAVSDTGPGIEAAEQERIFRPFARLGAAEGTEGLGLGLALAAHLCRRLGGDLSVASDGRSGTTFYARFAAQPSPVPAAAAAPDPGSLAGRRVLVADDNALVREILAAQLARLGAKCETVADGEAALALAFSGKFSAVVLDLSMPRLDGLEVARRIRARCGPTVRIVGASAHAAAADRTRALAAGMDAFVTKPVNLAALAAALDCVPGAAGNEENDLAPAALARWFRREVPPARVALCTAWRLRDWAALERQAHYLRNSALAVSDAALGAACSRLEESAVARDEAAAGRSWLQCEAELARWL